MIRLFKVLLAALILIISLVLFLGVQTEVGDNFNGKELVTQLTPILENNQLRAIFEMVGAEDYWDKQLRKITANKELKELEINLDSNIECIVESPIDLDVSQSALENSIYVIKVGDSAAHVVDQLGQPARKDAIDLGFTWWVYNQDYANYVQIGIKDNKVVALFTNATSMQFNDLKIGSTLAEIKEQYSFGSDLTFSLQGATFTINPVNENRYLVLQGNDTAYIFYTDIHQYNTLTAIRMVNLETLVLLRLYPYSFSFLVEPEVTKFVTSGPVINQTNLVYGQQVFDLTNVMRHRFNLPLLTWHQGLSQVASGHSNDMRENNFFAHESQATGSPFDRIGSAGISYRTAGENIAMGQSDASEAVMGWMNSLGHRKGILNHNFQHLGVGVIGTREAGRYYTQKFIGN